MEIPVEYLLICILCLSVSTLVCLVVLRGRKRRIKNLQDEQKDSQDNYIKANEQYIEYKGLYEQLNSDHKILNNEHQNLRQQYLPILDINNAVSDAQSELESLNRQIREQREKFEFDRKTLTRQQNEKTAELSLEYASKKVYLDKLLRQVAIYDEAIELAELGFYKPHFSFDTSERYKKEIEKIRARQKQMLADKRAVVCHTEWVVEGSKTKGKTMTNRNIKLTTKAFNNECDAALANVSWNNVTRMESRITKAFTSINKLNETNNTLISNEYLELKLNELRLTHEYKDKRQQEKEEQAEIKLQMREEARLKQEAEKAQKEEENYQKLLNKALRSAEKATGDKLDSLNNEIDRLKNDLENAHNLTERAKSMAEQTKQGHVYVISNIGSFGKGVYKIGMTRRLEPLDRVRELGDASVPFLFDVHAMIFSKDAPGLEKELHRLFDDKRVNLVNYRKEFFEVTLPEIQSAVSRICDDAEFIETAEAREYRESEAIRAQRKDDKESVKVINELPETI